MPKENQPASPQQAPDPSDSYERSHPEHEAGMGRMDNNAATPSKAPDRQDETVENQQDPTRQINAEDVVNQRAGKSDKSMAHPAGQQPDHSMHDEEPNGWDQAPTDIHDPKMKRHPRTEGRGGTP